MIAYGFTYTQGIFEDPVFEATVSIVTENGTYLSGKMNDLTVTEPSVVPGDLPHTLLSRIAENVEDDRSRAEAAAVTVGGTWMGPLIVRLPSPPDIELAGRKEWEAVARLFAQAYSAGDGADGDVSSFCRAVADSRGQRRYLADSARASEAGGDAGQGGTAYVGRYINGAHGDLDVLRSLRRAGMHAILSGAPGNGKTRAASAAHGADLVTLACYDGMAVQDLVGQYLPEPGTAGVFRWVDGPLVTAMEDGRALLLDDFGWMPPGVQATLLPVLDHQRTLSVLDRPGESTIVAADGFAVLINVNPNEGFGVIGPVRNRCAIDVHVPLDLAAAERLGVPRALVELTRKLQAAQAFEEAQGGSVWVPSLRALLKARDLQGLFDQHFAASSLLSECPEGVDRDRVRQLMESELNLQFDGDGSLSSKGL